VDRPLRLISTNPVDRLARTVEALLVVASAPLSVDELAQAADDDAERVETALGLLAERYREGRSGIVLEKVAGGYAFRAAREAADACGRLFERPVERGLSQAALETLAVVAYLGPCSRPEIARIRGVAADSAVASLVERGLIAEAGREEAPGGAVRYRTTALFERVFGLDSLSALPRLDDLGEGVDEIRERLVSVAEARAS
jgi:segregation and condensation protein B